MITINIVPRPAARPRFSKWGTYNTPEYTKYKKELTRLVKKNTKHEPIETPLKLTVNFWLPIPKMSKKKMSEHEGVAHYKKPDLDNLVKALSDAMNEVVFKDDNIVSSIVAHKCYSSEPRIEYKVEVL